MKRFPQPNTSQSKVCIIQNTFSGMSVKVFKDAFENEKDQDDLLLDADSPIWGLELRLSLVHL